MLALSYTTRALGYERRGITSQTSASSRSGVDPTPSEVTRTGSPKQCSFWDRAGVFRGKRPSTTDQAGRETPSTAQAMPGLRMCPERNWLLHERIRHRQNRKARRLPTWHDTRLHPASRARSLSQALLCKCCARPSSAAIERGDAFQSGDPTRQSGRPRRQRDTAWGSLVHSNGCRPPAQQSESREHRRAIPPGCGVARRPTSA